MWSLWEGISIMRALKNTFYENTGNSMVFCAYIQAACVRSMTRNHFWVPGEQKKAHKKKNVWARQHKRVELCLDGRLVCVWCVWCGCGVTVLCDRSSAGGRVPCSWVVSPAVLRFPDSPGSVLTAGRLTVTSSLCWVSLWACLLLLKSLCPFL